MIASVERVVARWGWSPEARLRRAAQPPRAPEVQDAPPDDAPPPPKRRVHHHFKRDLAFAAILVLAAGLTLIAFEYVGFLKQAERFVDDVRTARMMPDEPQHPGIVIAAITEDTLAQFPYRSPVNRAFLASLL